MSSQTIFKMVRMERKRMQTNKESDLWKKHFAPVGQPKEVTQARENKRRDAASSAAIVIIFLLVALTHLLALASHFGAADPLIWWQQWAYAADDGPGGNAVAPDQLLSPDLEDKNSAACLSRHEASRRWKPTQFPVPPYLVERLRRYEANHRRCGPRTALYREAVSRLRSASRNADHAAAGDRPHTCNRAWGIVDRFFEGYLAGADERVGMHVRNKQIFPVPPEIMFEQILRCAREHHLLPQVLATSEPPTAEAKKKKKKAVAVLMLSLKPEYHDKLHAMYYTNATADGNVVVSVHQPSHDGEQQSDARAHNERALAEIYLLSFCETMVSTGWSTFGYVAQGLAGIPPWMLLPVNRSKMRADVACVRPPSVEPCMHPQPSLLTCQQGAGLRHLDDPVKRVPFLRHCEDVPLGLKLFD
ncbi:Galactoside 2-alpha-L-fucosyltransferase [Triticum urartu]|uniref:Fucosyltransferase n=1 Tax=Triticum urartu TaxID=4572 RepID=M7Z0M4_TRIUA|nr:Galactoside 2-alpha-L-fucosyltransferase [Triticum urartu]